MSLRDLRDTLTPLPLGALVPASWVLEQLDEDVAQTPAATAGAMVDFTVPDIASRFHRAASTIRTWCENGQLPGAYRLNGREWRIPASAVHALQQAAAERKRPAKSTESPKATDVGTWRDHLQRRQA